MPVTVGYTEASFVGEAVSDRVVTTVAESVGAKLIKVKLINNKLVSDEALCTLVRSAPLLQCFIAEGLGGVHGRYIAEASCRCHGFAKWHKLDRVVHGAPHGRLSTSDYGAPG